MFSRAFLPLLGLTIILQWSPAPALVERVEMSAPGPGPDSGWCWLPVLEGMAARRAIIPPVINVAYRSGGGGGRGGRPGSVRDRHHTRGWPRSPCKPRHHQPLCLPLNITTRNSLWWTHSSVGPRTIETSTLSAILTRAREGLFHKYRLGLIFHHPLPIIISCQEISWRLNSSLATHSPLGKLWQDRITLVVKVYTKLQLASGGMFSETTFC